MARFVWSLLDPEAVNDYGTGVGKPHYGYYIYVGGRTLWIGFIDGAAFSTGPAGGGSCALVVGVQSDAYEVSLPSGEDIEPVEIENWTPYGWQCAQILLSPDNCVFHASRSPIPCDPGRLIHGIPVARST